MLRAVQNTRGRVRHGIRAAGFGTAPSGVVPSPWSTTRKGSEITLSNSNFTAASGGQSGDWCQTDTTLASASAQKVYFEVLVNAKNSDFFYVGLINSGWGYENTGISGNQMMRKADGNWSVGGGSNPPTFTTGDVLGFAIDFSSTQKIRAFKNNVESGLSPVIPADTYRIGAINTFGTSPNTVTIRTTLAEFSYTPPVGYVPWAAVAT